MSRSLVVARLQILASFAALSGLYWAIVSATVGPGFPLDDTYIHLQFARRLAEEGQLAFNAHQPSSGCTAPLYALLLALVHAAVPSWPLAAHLLGAVAVVGTALAVHQGLWAWTGNANLARTGGLLCAFAAPTLANAYSGMETGVAAFVVTTGFVLYGAPRARLVGSLLLAGSIGLRPETLLLGPLILLERGWAARRSSPQRRARMLELAVHALIWLFVVALWSWSSYRRDGQLLPGTFAAKAVARSGGHLLPWWFDGVPAALAYGHWKALPLALVGWPLAILLSAPICLWLQCHAFFGRLHASVRAALTTPVDQVPYAPALRVLAAFGVLLPLVRGAIDPVAFVTWQLQRYYPFLLPLTTLLVLGTWTRRGEPREPRPARWLALALAGTLLFGAWQILAVGNINQQQVEMARWIKAHSAPGDLIATNDIGALAFLADRPILDLVGLVDPALVHAYLQGGSVEAYVEARRPAWVVVFPRWFPLLVRSPQLTRVHSESLGVNVISGGKELVAFKAAWPDQAAPPRE